MSKKTRKEKNAEHLEKINAEKASNKKNKWKFYILLLAYIIIFSSGLFYFSKTFIPLTSFFTYTITITFLLSYFCSKLCLKNNFLFLMNYGDGFMNFLMSFFKWSILSSILLIINGNISLEETRKEIVTVNKWYEVRRRKSPRRIKVDFEYNGQSQTLPNYSKVYSLEDLQKINELKLQLKKGIFGYDVVQTYTIDTKN